MNDRPILYLVVPPSLDRTILVRYDEETKTFEVSPSKKEEEEEKMKESKNDVVVEESKNDVVVKESKNEEEEEKTVENEEEDVAAGRKKQKTTFEPTKLEKELLYGDATIEKKALKLCVTKTCEKFSSQKGTVSPTEELQDSVIFGSRIAQFLKPDSGLLFSELVATELERNPEINWRDYVPYVECVEMNVLRDDQNRCWSFHDELRRLAHKTYNR